MCVTRSPTGFQRDFGAILGSIRVSLAKFRGVAKAFSGVSEGLLRVTWETRETPLKCLETLETLWM